MNTPPTPNICVKNKNACKCVSLHLPPSTQLHPPPPQRHTIRSYTDMWPRVYLSTIDALFHACRKRVVSSASTHTVKRLPFTVPIPLYTVSQA